MKIFTKFTWLIFTASFVFIQCKKNNQPVRDVTFEVTGSGQIIVSYSDTSGTFKTFLPWTKTVEFHKGDPYIFKVKRSNPDSTEYIAKMYVDGVILRCDSISGYAASLQFEGMID